MTLVKKQIITSITVGFWSLINISLESLTLNNKLLHIKSFKQQTNGGGVIFLFLYLSPIGLINMIGIFCESL